MNQNCKNCAQDFEIADWDLQLIDQISPVFQGKKFSIPAPVLCPNCRQQRRMAYRNERSLYKRDCKKCHKTMLSVYSEDKPFTIYCRDCWWADDWSGTDFAQDFDFNRPFFDQYYELMKKVPQLGILNAFDQNSEYSNYGYQNKDCYLMFTADFNEKCSYGCFVWKSFDCYDNLFLIESQLCYECIDCVKSYGSAYCRESEGLTDCFGCVDCRNCESCFGSSGLRNKKYHFFNEALTKEEYEKKVADAKANWPETLRKFKEVGKETPRRNLFLVQCENTLGDHLKNCKNCSYCFDSQELEECKYVTNAPVKCDHILDIDGAGWLFWSYQCIATQGNHHLFSDHHWPEGSDLTYCSFSCGSSNCFGCVGIRKGKYCILNKQYSKEEYEKLAARIVEHMIKTGEWSDCFLPKFSRFAYNETLAQQYYPLSKEEVLNLGYQWHEESADKTGVDLENIVMCEVSGKPFRLTKQELEFYKKLGLPSPKRHPEIRMKDRDALRNPRQFWTRNCDSCGTAMQTTYSPDRPEKVYCEACYLKTVY